MNLSIIIPTYNRNDTLVGCIQALDHNGCELIVIDDGSEIPVEAPEHVRILRQSKNRGRAAAINWGLRAASHDMVLVLDDDIYAAPDMVIRLVDEFRLWNNPKLALVGRVVWDPEIPLTPTMQWMEEVGPFHEISANRAGAMTNLFTCNTVLWRPFVLEHGGFDEHFDQHTLEDTELGLRLRRHGLEVRLHPAAIGYHHKQMIVQDLVDRQMREGFSAVYLHSKFSDHVAHVDDAESLRRNLEREGETAAAVEQITKQEHGLAISNSATTAELFMLVYRYCSLRGIFDGLKAAGSARQQPASPRATMGLYEAAEYFVALTELEEARRLFRLVRERQDQEYWAAAEYHLGTIESVFGNQAAAQGHFQDCLRLDPSYEKALTALSSAS